MSINLVEVACFNFPTDPDFLLFASILEGEGIPFACPERLQLEMQPFLSIGLGGLRVLVHDFNAEKAKILLQNLPSAQTEQSAADQFGVNHAPLSTDWFDTAPYQPDTETHLSEPETESLQAKPFQPDTHEPVVEADDYETLPDRFETESEMAAAETDRFATESEALESETDLSYADDDLQAQPTWDRIRFWLVILLVGYLVYTLVSG